MRTRLTLNRLLIGAITFCILCVCGSFLYVQNAKKEVERVKAEAQAILKAQETQRKQQAAAAAQKVSGDEANPSPAPYHPHDDLTPEEHRRVHAEIERELNREIAKIEVITQRLSENTENLQAGRVTYDESGKIIEIARQELETIRATIRQIEGKEGR